MAPLLPLLPLPRPLPASELPAKSCGSMSRLCKVEAGQVDKGTFIINGLAALGSLPGNRAAHVNTDSVRMLFEQMMVYQAITEDKMFVQTLDVPQLKRLLPVAQA